MKTIVLRTVLVAIFVLLVGKIFLARAKSAPQDTFGVCVSQIRREWGQFKGGSQATGIAFEDARGTLRFVTNLPCNGSTPPIALEVKRTAPN